MSISDTIFDVLFPEQAQAEHLRKIAQGTAALGAQQMAQNRSYELRIQSLERRVEEAQVTVDAIFRVWQRRI